MGTATSLNLQLKRLPAVLPEINIGESLSLQIFLIDSPVKTYSAWKVYLVEHQKVFKPSKKIFGIAVF